MLLDDIWPVRNLRVEGPVLHLEFPNEDHLAQLAALASDGIYDPQNRYLPRSPVAGWDGGGTPHAERSFLRYYWASLADWSPQRWNLMFAVVANGRCIGVQEIGAQHFSVTRTVSTGSWLAREHQRLGYGTAMRVAVLQLAFELGADRAESAAWATNSSSLGVSRALGYRPNGVTIRVWRDEPHEQVNLVLNRTDWASRPDVEVIGVSKAAREFLGAPGP